MTPLCQSLQIDVFQAELKLGFQASEPRGLLFALVQKHPARLLMESQPVAAWRQTSYGSAWLCAKQLAYVITRDPHRVL